MSPARGPGTARGAAHFLRETVGRVRYGGVQHSSRAGRQRLRLVSACRWTHGQPAASRRRRTGLPFPTGWTAACRDDLHPVQTKPDAAPVRLIVRRVKPTPGLALFARYSYHGHRDPGTGGRSSPPRVENAIRDLKYGVGLNHMLRFAANGAWLALSSSSVRSTALDASPFAFLERQHRPRHPSLTAYRSPADAIGTLCGD